MLKKPIVQQNLHQSFANIKTRSLWSCISCVNQLIIEQSLMNDARNTNALTQISRNTQKINEIYGKKSKKEKSER